MLPLLVFSLDLRFFSFIWGSGVFIENPGFFYSDKILEMYVVLLYFPFKNIVVSRVARSLEIFSRTFCFPKRYGGYFHTFVGVRRRAKWVFSHIN